MYNNKKILAVIPARGGSKGLKNKNILNLIDKPLIAHTIEKANQSVYLDEVFVSTDSMEISNISKQWGGKVPILRPGEYALDSSPSYEAILHALNYFNERGDLFDYIALLEPTSPLRKDNDIDNAIQLMVEHDEASTLVSVGEVHMEHPSIVKKVENGFVNPYCVNEQDFHQRQQLSKAYFPYGVIYISKVEYYMEFKTFYSDKTIPYFIDRWQNYEIDDIIDFKIIETIISNTTYYG